MKRAFRAAVWGLCLVGAACRARQEAAPPPTPAPRPAPTARQVLGFLDESHEGTPVDGGVLQRRLTGEPTTLNAVLQSSAPEAQVLQYVQRNLFDFDARLALVPGLASRLDVSPDGLAYTVSLNPNAVWEDGHPVTSRDAVFTIRKVSDPKIPSPVFKPVFEEMESLEALDAATFRVRFRKPYAFRSMAFVMPLLPEHRFAGQNFLKAKDNRAPLSDGPYRVVSWKAQESIELERNEKYAGPRGHFDRVVFRIVPDNTTAYRLLLEGGLDEDQVDAGLKERAGRDPAFASCCRLVEFYNLDYNYVALNNKSPLFADARVRRAMTMLLDRAAIVGGLYRGSARIISGPWAPDSPAYDAAVPPLPFDPAAAARLLDEAGWKAPGPGGVREREGRRFEFDLLVSAGSEIGRQIDEMLAAELAMVGVAARVRAMEWAAFVERIDAGEFEAASLAWSAADPNPDPYYYWHSSQCAPKGLNDGCYASADADRLMEETRREADAGRRAALLHRLHRMLRDDAPAIFVVNASQKYAFRRRVRGLATSPLGLSGIWPGPLGLVGGTRTGAGAVTAYVLRRLLLAVPTLFGIAVVVFLLLRLAPGGPGAGGADSVRRVSGRAAEEMRRLYGLDRPLPEQFALWIGRVARLDLGESFVDHRPVAERIREALPHTLALNGLALLFALAFAIPLGVVAGGNPEGAFDRASGVALFALYSLPTFWAALLLQTLFSVKLRWLPLYGTASDTAPAGLAGLADSLAHLALPVTCLTYGTLAFVARLVRSGVAEARRSDYVLAARARGASPRRALWGHAFRNALLPVITLFGLLLPALLSGSVIVEKIFAWPGLGRLYFDSILARDYPVILALSLLSAVATLAATLLSDIAVAAADPRVRDGAAG